MPWNLVSTNAGPPVSGAKYSERYFANPPGGLAYGVTVEAPGMAALSRLRIGFYYPLVFVGGERFLGASEEMMPAPTSDRSPIHFISYSYVPAAVLSSATDEVFGVFVAVDRGVGPHTVKLWRFVA